MEQWSNILGKNESGCFKNSLMSSKNNVNLTQKFTCYAKSIIFYIYVLS